MGLLRNYRWLKGRDLKPYPKPDFAKLAATKSELDLLDYIRKINGVVEAFHSSRINQITTGRSRREADVIVLMNDRIVFIEVKNYKGDITMQDNVLYQNGQSRGWTFAKLEEAVGRFREISREVGIVLESDVIETVLACVGNGEVKESVQPKAITGSFVADSKEKVKEILCQPREHFEEFDSETIKALNTLLSMFGTWDSIQFPNEARHEGDLTSPRIIREWRVKYRELRIINARGWWSTLFKGPKFTGELIPRQGDRIEVIDLEYEDLVGLHNPHEMNDEEHPYEDLATITFGYTELQDWSKVQLITKQKAKASEANEAAESTAPQEGDIVRQARVINHLTGENEGIVFRLNKKMTGVYWRNKMTEMEWTLKDATMAVNSAHDVEITSSRYVKSKKRWQIQVKTVE
jgi:hypothetical protein